MKMRIAGAQLPVTEDVEANLAAIVRALDFAHAHCADVLLTPEGSLSGYTPRFEASAVTHALEAVTAAARAAGVGLALGTCFVEPDDGRCYDELRFYAPDGEFLGFHSKVLRCGTVRDEPPRGELNDYATRPLRTFTLNGVTIGGLICNDLWANPEWSPMPDPHLTQQLARMGARVVFHSVNAGRSAGEMAHAARRFHESNLRMRARAGRLYVATVDVAASDERPSLAPSGIVGPEGSWLVRAPDRGEQYYVADVAIPES